MNKILVAITLVASMAVNVAQAQVTPDIDMSNPTDLAGVKTDPVLSNPLDLISVNTDPVLTPLFDSKYGLSLNLAPAGVAGISLNFSSPETLRGYSSNPQPVLDLLGMMAKQGSKVEARIVEKDGLSILEAKVNGKPITSMVIECDHCKIEFEY